MIFDNTLAVLQHGIAVGEHFGAQLYVSRSGETLIDTAVGASQPGIAMTADSLTLWMSAGKPIAAVAIAQLLERGLLLLDDRVTKHIPEFGSHGKEPITIRHLLLHTGGFRGPMGSFEAGSWESQIQKACNLRLEPMWTPGEKAGYHPGSSWFILGELVRRLSGKTYDRYIRDEIFLPLGERDVWVGLPLQVWNDYGDRIAPTFITDPKQKNVVTRMNDAEIHELPRPGANARGPIHSLGRLYEALIGNTDRNVCATRCLGISKRTIDRFTSRQRIGMFDHTFKCNLDWGLGFMFDSKQYAGEHAYGYGVHASPETFGHSGNQCSCAFADPTHGLVVAWICNGMPGDETHDRRQRAINAAVYDDLSLSQYAGRGPG
jgi:CubicO group peptidase (beta-lactamase class C family)